MATKPAVMIVALGCAGLLVQFGQYGVSASQAELDAQRAVGAGVRMAQHALRQAGDNDVTLLPSSGVAPPPGSHWLVRLKKVEWTYRPWQGARRTAFNFTVCYGAGALLADARLREGRWQVRLSPTSPRDCPRPPAN